MTRKVVYETITKTYLKNTLATEFTNKISEAKNFSWMGIFRFLYLWSLRKQYPTLNFIFVKSIQANAKISISPKIIK